MRRVADLVHLSVSDRIVSEALVDAAFVVGSGTARVDGRLRPVRVVVSNVGNERSYVGTRVVWTRRHGTSTTTELLIAVRRTPDWSPGVFATGTYVRRYL